MSAETTKPLNIFQRINRVMAAMDPVDKTGRNDFHKYNFIKAEVLFAALQKKLAEAGIVVVPTIDQVMPSPDGSKVLLASMRFHVINADDPADRVEIPWYAQGSAGDDKAIAKCVTSGMKYMLMRLFFISDEEDPDAEGQGETTAQGRQQAQQRPPTRTPQAAAQRASTTAPTHLAVVPQPVDMNEVREAVARGFAQDPEAAAKVAKKPSEMTDGEATKTLAWLVRRARVGKSQPADDNDYRSAISSAEVFLAVVDKNGGNTTLEHVAPMQVILGAIQKAKPLPDDVPARQIVSVTALLAAIRARVDAERGTPTSDGQLVGVGR